ncbi:DUF6555 family protein [Pseudomonas shirazensis]|uniref:Uncharacterized protein n=2 Tax=Pseudomonas TaxID=286 RepID=A0A2S3WEX5_PSEPU|nr:MULTISPECIES: DUF6555 family protein [Pseudomonas]MBA1322157.1 hypothetical protein [Pseudomonas plecoglossicida]MBO0368426.1 hypothetical protein [Pseudomonas putida]MBV4500114.1 hypothetical protein [Pseudomonas shirazensis]POF89492.1 hypothetical protein BGP80_16590 [Pseudomonas putida]
MAEPQLYVIEYELHGEFRTFIIRLERMNNTEAWHWASCDAGVGIIPRFGQHNLKKVSRPMAERYGISDVRWRASGQGAEFVAPPIDVKKFSNSGTSNA